MPDDGDAIDAEFVEYGGDELRLPLDGIAGRRGCRATVADQVEADNAVIGGKRGRNVVPQVDSGREAMYEDDRRPLAFCPDIGRDNVRVDNTATVPRRRGAHGQSMVMVFSPSAAASAAITTAIKISQRVMVDRRFRHPAWMVAPRAIGPLAPVVVLEADDIVLAEIVADLNHFSEINSASCLAAGLRWPFNAEDAAAGWSTAISIALFRVQLAANDLDAA